MAEKNVDALQNATEEILNGCYDLTYTLEHFIRKSNKSTALDVRNTLRKFEDLKKQFRDTSIGYFKDSEWN